MPGLQFWVGGAGGAKKRLDGLMVWLRIYWQGRISAKPGDTASMGIKRKKSPPNSSRKHLPLADPAVSALSTSRLRSRAIIPVIIPVMNVLILFAGILPRVINTVNSQTGSPI